MKHHRSFAMMPAALRAAGLVLALCLWACASGPSAGKTESAPADTQKIKKPGVERLEKVSIESVRSARPVAGRYANLVISPVQAGEVFRKDYAEPLEQFKLSILSHLRAKNAYANVAESAGGLSGATVVVEPEVVDMRMASFAARFWGGALAGASYMDVYLKLTEKQSGKVLDEKVINTVVNPFAAAWTVGASDASLPMDMGKIIGEYLYTVVPAQK